MNTPHWFFPIQVCICAAEARIAKCGDTCTPQLAPPHVCVGHVFSAVGMSSQLPRERLPMHKDQWMSIRKH